MATKARAAAERAAQLAAAVGERGGREPRGGGGGWFRVEAEDASMRSRLDKAEQLLCSKKVY